MGKGIWNVYSDIGNGNGNARIYITGEAQIYGFQAEEGTTVTDYILPAQSPVLPLRP